MDFITIPLTFGIGALSFYKVIELFAKRKERIMIIEKLSELSNTKIGELDMSDIFGERQFKSKYISLRIGSLLMGLGLGLLIGFFIISSSVRSSGIASHDIRQTMSIIYGASTLCFGGLGLIAGFIAEILLEKRKQ